jgi:hypothetical protein
LVFHKASSVPFVSCRFQVRTICSRSDIEGERLCAE